MNNQPPQRNKNIMGNHMLNNQGRRKRSNNESLSNSRGRGAAQNINYKSPYASHNMIDRQMKPPNQNNSFTNPRENKFFDRSSIPNRQGARQERSLPPATNHVSGLGPPAGDGFVVPGPQHLSKPSKSINRHNVLNLIGNDQ